MSECKNGTTNAKPSLAEFVNRIRGNKLRLETLYEKLDWAIHLFYSIPGPVYGGVPSHSNVYQDRICENIDRIDRIERKIKAVEDEEVVLHNFEKKLTPKELTVFRMYFFKDKSQAEIGLIMKISQQAISAYIKNINKKWMFQK